MQLDQWLKQVYDEEVLIKEASGLEILFDRMDPAALLEVACNRVSLEKAAADLSQAKREKLPAKSFAVPESKAKKIGVAGEIQGESKGKYPIPDEKHARNALARVSQHGTPAEREAVRKKVYAKYPQLREGFEERHGESPTSKENVKKVEQGGIGKTSQAKLIFMDKVAREIARQHAEVAKGYNEGKKGLVKQDAFTTPEAQQKAKVMRTAMKATKGAPPKVRKAAVKQVGKKIASV